MAPRIAVTGANGFIGRQLTRLASTERFEVVGLVRSDAAARAVVECGGRSARVEGLDAAALAEALAGAGVVVHLAQIGAERDGATYEAVNVAGTRAVIDAARRAGVPRAVMLSGLGVARYGMAPRCTNRYFLSKLAAEVELFRSGLEAVVFRPSYVLGPGGELIPDLLGELAAGEVERVGDGRYRMQPIALRDAAAAILAAAVMPLPRPAAFDLVGPEPLAYADFVERLARAAAALGLAASYQVREVPLADAERQAAAGGYRGMLRDELDCLLCDEVADPRPLEALLGRFLTPVDEALTAALRPLVEPRSRPR